MAYKEQMMHIQKELKALKKKVKRNMSRIINEGCIIRLTKRHTKEKMTRE